MSANDRVFSAIFVISAIFASLVLSGCGSPSAVNIKLRKENQALRTKIEDLERRHNADVASIRAHESSATTVPSLPQAQLEKLFTVHGIQFGRLTGPADWDPSSPGDDGLKIYVTPTDNAGQQLKAAGAIVVEAFDLAAGGNGENVRIGRWEFPLEDASKHWIGQALVYAYVLQVPWQQRPQHSDLTVKVTFTDALTGRTFGEQKVVKVTPTTAAAAR
jgi:outer membrane murein-binding lipoprotein Lpp